MAAQFIAAEAGFEVPEGTKFLIVPETGFGKAHPFSGEKMTVTMALYHVPNIDAAVEMTNSIQSYQVQTLIIERCLLSPSPSSIDRPIRCRRTRR